METCKAKTYLCSRQQYPHMKQFCTLLLSLLFTLSLQAQAHLTLSDSSRISLMTVAPGEMVYSTFGHSAIRVKDPVNRFDRCYNYGTFDFEQPNFLLRFCQGKLLYNLDVESYRGFEFGNLHDLRPMKEQICNMNLTERQRIFDLLQENYKEENRYYKYDFFYDNCATRIRDIFEETYFHQLAIDSSGLPPGRTMRQLLHDPYLISKPWLGFGIDLVLGLPADHRATTSDYMFLPDYVHDVFAKAKTPEGLSLVKAERSIPEMPAPQMPFHPSPLDRPLWVMSFVALIGLLSMANPRTEHIFDTIFWLVLGIAGLIIFLLWFATDHTATKYNLNILWAWPTHLFFFWKTRRTGATENYFMVAGVAAALLLMFWHWMPQEFPVAAIPLVVLIVIKGLWRRFWR